MPHIAPLLLGPDGAELFARALDADACRGVEGALGGLPTDRPGLRIGAAAALASWLSGAGAIADVARRAFDLCGVRGGEVRAVRAILFNKTADRNWALAPHQDRTIAVAERHAVAGFGPWSVKSGLMQVEPPFAILERMVTLRVHLDPVDAANAPLRIVPGSHRLGRIAEGDIPALVARRGERRCLAERGDIWAYATPVVHASDAAAVPRARRVLQIDYSVDTLPAPLDWRGL